ncbi:MULTISPECIES: primase-helicase family protein [unclassified Bradyrhizobium]|uniref:primase-helicase family protein n=1 Tax=unclassified Bradyrhizobium TaxID=2631580 RepID=UPI00339B7471
MLTPSTRNLPVEGSPEYEAECERVHKELAAKFAWTVQSEGMIYRQDPAFKPMRSWLFNKVSRRWHSFRYLTSEGKERLYWISMDDIGAEWDDNTDVIGVPLAERVEFMPGMPPLCLDDIGRSVLNIWQAPLWEARPSHDEPTPFIDLVRHLFDEDQQAIDHVMDFIAHLVQHPDERVNHAMLLTSEAKGIGKSTLGTIIRRLVGERNSGVAQSKDLKSQFDGWLMGKLVVQVDEVYEQGNTDLANRLKPILTEPTVSANVKYGPQLVVKNFARLILFSNQTAPIDIEEGDRRYFVFDSKALPRDADYYDRLNAFIDSDEGMSAIYWWLKGRCLASFKPKAAPPLTAHKTAAIEVSGNPLRHYLEEAVRSGHLLNTLGPDFTMDALQRQLANDGFAAQAKSVKEVGMALKAAGVSSVRTMVNGKRARVHRLPDWAIHGGEPTDF